MSRNNLVHRDSPRFAYVENNAKRPTAGSVVISLSNVNEEAGSGTQAQKPISKTLDRSEALPKSLSPPASQRGREGHFFRKALLRMLPAFSRQLLRWLVPPESSLELRRRLASKNVTHRLGRPPQRIAAWPATSRIALSHRSAVRFDPRPTLI